ncbi:Phosphoglycerate mutase [Beauveria brongniartii RCEF 3172]|uniref:Phosphoglycerate mutase n=1 Tax=Beauveria brongniartii RCEF 3172 TaxID=1081107 RepID=A0A167AJE9_9HYPO|nr:Phosphoglycerate mutase [Beauveria brongniartii RCEF 3172]
MAKPRLIILIRHAQSEGNKNRDIHQSVPDHRVKLTPDGWSQAYDAGRRLRALLRPDDTLQIFTSPYRRTRDTTEGILTTLTSDADGPSPFRRANIKVYEEPRLREQDFGNFQPCSAEMERMWQERADYGHFFYRIPNGESAADAYDRVSGFNESLWRQFGEDDFASVCVLVTHGLMSRVFLMKWYHFTVEYFEDLRNIDHCEFLVMRKQDNGKFNLETKLRTWSELKRERAALKEKEKGKEKDKGAAVAPASSSLAVAAAAAAAAGAAAAAEADGGGAGAARDDFKLQRNKTFVVTRRWGGCPDGCNHTSKYLKRQDLESLRQKDSEQATLSSHKSAAAAPHRHRAARPTAVSSDSDSDGCSHHHHHHHHRHHHHSATPSGSSTASPDRKKPASTTASASIKTLPLPPPSLQSPHLGRDFGGSYSGHASVADSDSDKPDDAPSDTEESRHAATATTGTALHHRRRRGSILNSIEARLLQSTINSHHARQRSSASSFGSAASPGIGPFANRLGDAPALGSGGGGGGGAVALSDDEGDVPTTAAATRGKGPTTPGCEHDEDAEAGHKGGVEDIEAAEKADRSIQGSVY